jgi:hypothetical protein
VQFANDVGGESPVRYINAESPNLFPGKGFLFTRLKFERCFAPIAPKKGEKKSDGFDVYRSAWPDLAPIFADFYRTEFLFLRGLIAISCKSGRYNLRDEKGTPKHYAFVVFNDHFRNPFQEVAYLVPAEGLKPLLQGAQVAASDFVGFDTRLKDVNTNVRSPRDLINAPIINELAIDIGGIDAMLGGAASGARSIQGTAAFMKYAIESQQLDKDTRRHNQLITKWNARQHSYHLSTEGRHAYHGLQHEFESLNSRRRRLDEQLVSIETDAEMKVWDLVERYVSLHKLFCIAHAYWHRGYTLGRVVSTAHISSENAGEIDDFALPTPDIRQNRAEISSSIEVPTNRNALRMLVQAYELHSQRERPGTDRSSFPILVTCNALKTGVHPENWFMLDTYDMTVTLKGQKIPLSKGKMTGDDESFWLHHIFPLVKDEPGLIRDLRFYPRESIEAYN